MEAHPEGSGSPSGVGNRRNARYIVRLGRDQGHPVIRVLDARSRAVLRQITASEFVEFAKSHRHVTAWLLGRDRAPVTPSETV